MKNKNLFIAGTIFTSITVLLALWLVSVKNEMKKNAETLNEVIRAREIDLSEKYNLKRKNDSLFVENQMMSSQRALTQMMHYRDAAASWAGTPSPGELVALKPVMDTVVVAGVIAGGTAHEHFVKVRVVRKNGETIDVDPSMINKTK